MAEKSNYKTYITGLKGFACVMVMIGHFLGVFAYAENMPFDIHLFLAIRDSKVGFLLDESYWLYLFFIVSGYLLAFSKIDRLQQLFAKWIQRFLRLGLPILFAYGFIYIVYLTIGFHNGETSTFFENTWFQKAYSGSYSFLTVLMSPIDVLLFGRCSLNSPYWVLREMLIASLIIYLASYLKNKTIIQKWGGNWIVPIASLGIAFVVSHFLDSKIIIFCVLGAILSWCERDISSLKEKQLFYVFILLVALGLSIVDKSYIQRMFFIALLICIPKIKILNSIFSSRIFKFTGDISFGIYSFHWPLYCSIGALLIIKTADQVGLLSSILLAMVGSAVATFLISWLYHITCERFSGFITKKVYYFLSKPLKKA